MSSVASADFALVAIPTSPAYRMQAGGAWSVTPVTPASASGPRPPRVDHSGRRWSRNAPIFGNASSNAARDSQREKPIRRVPSLSRQQRNSSRPGAPSTFATTRSMWPRRSSTCSGAAWWIAIARNIAANSILGAPMAVLALTDRGSRRSRPRRSRRVRSRLAEPEFTDGQRGLLARDAAGRGRALCRSCRRTPDGASADATPAAFNVRTRVHEYGGGAFSSTARRSSSRTSTTSGSTAQDGGGDPAPDHARAGRRRRRCATPTGA